MNALPEIKDMELRGELLPAPSLERRRLRAYLLFVVTDVAAIFIAFLAAGALYLQRFPDPQASNQAYLLLPIYLTIALYQGTYSIRTLFDYRFAISRSFGALAISAALLAFVAFYLKAGASFSRVTLTLGLVGAGVLIALSRRIAVHLIERRWDGFVRNRLHIRDGGDELAIPFNCIVDARAAGIDPEADDPHSLDLLGRLLLNQDEVVVSCPLDRRAAWAFVLKANGVHGEILSPTAHELGALNVKHYEAADASTLVVSAGPLGLRARALKRAFDIAFSTLALILLLPFLCLLALAIWLEDRGPVLFVQQRTGRGNRFFRMYKFRSMRTDSSDADGDRSTARGDNRLTRIGRFIRAYSIDELPQLLNVLKGEMSIVGPRPHAPGSLAGEKKFWQVDARYWHRHALKPGLTGLAQVRGFRGTAERERDLSDRLQADLEYLAHWSLFRDLAIIAQTLLVLRHDRAY
ncbi:exopolysaccharide biosynthesis polyprenyl glycosylphosphotransferase [Erythrobacter litoralis]|uniref:Probable glycosyl transferase n=1 Tax=Erythrobacter litoralis (strain HTCC2594) TaxID=314225 RepID=Q2N6Z8_ERYLH|nr:exopolysaccharide biosynthesis polyprenyl glycosylphosphotransferase [Erythrobacter litoralis]ABC64543.1 probable glycosyl transferase [Erythrobacter litoralis HTCC2594]